MFLWRVREIPSLTVGVLLGSFNRTPTVREGILRQAAKVANQAVRGLESLSELFSEGARRAIGTATGARTPDGNRTIAIVVVANRRTASRETALTVTHGRGG